ncbi:hypothetical protein [Rhodopseudomonas sp.]|uniref:hypothetical protein n=1 Tax=Rhodopseudomonas sp. TaxID=1078 RepID=UPI003B3A180F
MRVSLVIDGDSKGAVEAATDASKAVTDLGKTATDTAKGLEDGFKKASGAAGSMKGSADAAGAANDNLVATASILLSKFGELAAKAKGSNDAIALNASTASSLTASLGALSRSVGVVGFLTGAFGVATAAVSAYYEIQNRGSANLEKNLTEQQRLIGRVRDAYSDTKNVAGQFYDQSKAFIKLQIDLSDLKLGASLMSEVGKTISNLTTYSGIEDFLAGVKQVKPEFVAFEDALFKLQDGFKAGRPDVKAFIDEIARITELNPQLLKAAGQVTDFANKAIEIATAKSQNDAARGLLKGENVAENRSRLNISRDVQDTAGQFERLAKSMDRQAASAEAEAAATGKSAGEIAKMRVEAVLTESAQQAGIKVAGEYADRVKQIGDRAGEAAQKLALARVQSDAAFQRKTLGLTADDAQIAEQLRGAYGDDVEKALNSSAAAALKFNQSMLQLKNTTLDVTKGAFSDFRTQLQQGATVWEAFGTAGVNALNRIIDKLADQALDNLVSGLFGAFTGGSGSGLLSSLFGGSSKTSFATDGIGGYGPTFAAADGGTFGPGWGVVGERGAEIIKVHAGGVTVFPHHVSKPYLPAFADGGSLDSLGNIARLPSLQTSSSGGSVGSAAPQEFRLSVSVDDDGKLKTVVTDVAKGIAQEVSAGTVKDFVRSPQFTDHVAQAYNAGKAAWKIR